MKLCDYIQKRSEESNPTIRAMFARYGVEIKE